LTQLFCAFGFFPRTVSTKGVLPFRGKVFLLLAYPPCPYPSLPAVSWRASFSTRYSSPVVLCFFFFFFFFPSCPAKVGPQFPPRPRRDISPFFILCEGMIWPSCDIRPPARFFSSRTPTALPPSTLIFEVVFFHFPGLPPLPGQACCAVLNV